MNSIAASLLLSGILIPLSHGQGVLVFDDFLTDNGGRPGQNLNGPLNPLSGFILWNVRDGTVDLDGPSALEPPGNLLGRYVNLGGSTGNPGIFSYAQPVTLLPSVTYTLSFVYKSTTGSPSTAKVKVGGRTVMVSTSSTGFQNFRQEFVFEDGITFLGSISQGIEDSPLSFEDQGDGTSGMAIDRIILLPTVASNEPSIAIEQRQGVLLISFTGTLQASDELEGFSDVPGAVSPYIVHPALAPRQFFRARRP